ncbi:MAG: flagellar filament capping protein FliD [Firmicutes bacterium]|nr:flagellar filament capping protein FliD [Bacillota bacterium]
MAMLNISGIGSGLDWKALIQEIVKLERRPVEKARSQETRLDERRNAWKDIRSRLETLQSRLDDLKDQGVFGARKTSSADETVLKAEAGSTAAKASYFVTVTNLAEAHRAASDRQADRAAALNLAGTFSLNGADITVGAADSLTDIRDEINGIAGIGVTASIIDNRLVLTSDTVGAAGTMAVLDDPSTLILESLGVLVDQGGSKVLKNEMAAARDAAFTVDGLSVTRANNDPDDVIPGVTLHLLAGSAAPVVLKVEDDPGTATEAIRQFTDQYNSAMDLIDTALGEKGKLAGDVTLMRIRMNLRQFVSGKVTGMSGTYQALIDAGIGTTGRGHTLAIDTAKLEQALKNAPATVEDLLFHEDAGIDGVGEKLESYLDLLIDAENALIPAKEDGLTARIKNVQTRIRDLDYRLQLREQNLTRQFVALERSLAILQGQSVELGWGTGSNKGQ